MDQELEEVILNAMRKCEGLDEKGTAEVIAKHVRSYLEKKEREVTSL